MSNMEIFEKYESEVRGYCRGFPTVFDKAKNATMWNTEGEEFVDFFGGAGALNYGHNNDHLKKALLQYIEDDRITHGLDMSTKAKEELLIKFYDIILKPRGLDYKIQFPGPTGTNTVEAALKLARKVKERELVISFTNGFHGMTLGALAVTANGFKRGGAGLPLGNATSMPFENYFGDDTDTLDYFEAFLEDSGSGMDQPAAVIVESIQAEGGVNVASYEWLKRLEKLCKRWDMLLIVDDVQMGCGRTGPFFSFEPADLYPDIVCLSKSIGGYGLPMAITLLKPELDVWDPGEHNGTFRGNNHAFVTATAAIEHYWQDDKFAKETEVKGQIIRKRMEDWHKAYPDIFVEVRGRGLVQAIECKDPEIADDICNLAFENGLIIESAGVDGQVVKALPALTITEEEIAKGLDLLEKTIKAVAEKAGNLSKAAE